jgi:predicted nicotinamide N-methyase
VIGEPLSIAVGGKHFNFLLPSDFAIPTDATSSTQYWARVWPAAEALANFIVEKPEWVRYLQVLELGAGLGLPSFVAAQWASHCTITDAEPQAVAALSQSLALNGISNASTLQANWRHVAALPKADVILLSDVNYDPKEFDYLLQLIDYQLAAKCGVLLSTPQRLLAKPFVKALLPWCTHMHERSIGGTYVSILEMLPGPAAPQAPAFLTQ